MIWVDRLALAWGVIYAALCFLAETPSGYAFAVGAYAVGGLWLVLRLLHFIFTTGQHRHYR
jgi:hypothetical protein